MNVLVACECSGRVKTAFRNKGHNAYSCDLKPSEIPDDKFHYQCDIREILEAHNKNKIWDLMIAHPDCTYLANSGVRWLRERSAKGLSRAELLLPAAYFFRGLLETDITKIAVENPIPHKYAVHYIGRKYDQIIQPYMFGEPETKATCLWLKGLPKLQPTNQVMPLFHSVHKEPPSPERKANKSRTFQGIANAMAEQWG